MKRNKEQKKQKKKPSSSSHSLFMSHLKEEKLLWQKGFSNIAGIDEAGRGPLAGPVTVAAVIMPINFRSTKIDDSKKLTAKQREYCFGLICEKALAFTIIHASVTTIEEINILNAVKRSMVQAVRKLTSVPDFVLIDGMNINVPGIPQKAIIGGDAISQSIAAASILAKVSRDLLMVDLDSKYPQYGFLEHKGYATEKHIAAIRRYGPCPVHRRTFLKKYGYFHSKLPDRTSQVTLEETLLSLGQ